MKKMVVMMYVYDEGSRQRIMETAAKFIGITSIQMGDRDGKLTVIGEFDMSMVLAKLKRRWRKAKIESFGPYNPNAERERARLVENERARLEANRENHCHYYSPMYHHSYIGEHHHYPGCTIS